MGRARIVDPDTERPPAVDGLPVLDQVVVQGDAARAQCELALPFDLRSRSRLRARLSDGREVAVVLPRGTVLRGGVLLAGAGMLVRVVAADEDIVDARADSAIALARAAYHLGNRHVPVQVCEDRLVLGYDPVLVDMLVRMGVRIQRGWAPFEPEGGAYGHAH